MNPTTGATARAHGTVRSFVQRPLTAVCTVTLVSSLACGSSSPATTGSKGNVDAGADPYASCTWNLGTGAQAAGPAPAQDDSADLEGAVIGTQAFDATQERRVVTVNVTTPLPGLTLGQAYLTRLSPTDETAYLTIPAAYSGTGTPCFIEATNVVWMSATGQKLNSVSNIYLDGSVGAASSTIDTDTCVAPGDSGYFIAIESQSGTAPLYSAVDSISLSLQSTTVGNAPAAKLTPTRYDVGTCSDTRTLRVEATIGGGTAAVGQAKSPGSLGPVVYLDSSGLPAGWTFVHQNQPANFVAGSTTSFYADLPFDPAVSRAQFFLPFDPPDAMFMSLPGFVAKAMDDVLVSRVALLQRWGAARALAASRAER